MKYMRIACVTSSGVLLCACARSGVDLEAERAALREADADYSEAAAAKDIERWVSWYVADATLYPPNSGAVTGIDAIREFGVEFSGMPDFSASFDPLQVEVSADGDMGYTLSNYIITLTGADGTPVTERGPDFHAWRKQADGSWKIVVDIWNSELPTPGIEDASQADQATISELHELEIQALLAGDVETLVSIVTDDAVLMPPNEPIVEGTGAQEAWLRGLFDQISLQGDVTVTDLTLAGDWAIEQYAYDFMVSPVADGDAAQEEGKGLHVYRRQPDGTWKMAVDIWNADASPPSDP